MSDLNPESDVSDQTVPRLADWLRPLQGFPPAPIIAPSVPELVCYLCGTLPADRAGSLESDLVAQTTSRRRLREVRTELRLLEALPWQAVAEAAQGSGQAAEVAAAWLALTSERMQAAERAPAHWRTTGWQAVRSQMAAGVGDALSAWNAFLNFGAQWSRELHSPGRFAMVRGAEAPADAILPGTTAPVEVTADIDPDDTLIVTLRVGARPEAPDASLDGRSVLLSLRNGTDLWPLATAPLAAGQADWHIPGFGAATGMPAGELPGEALQFTLTDSTLPLSTAAPSRLFAEIMDTEGRSANRGTFPIIFLDEPRWSGGEFLALVELPPETLYWLHSGYQLRLDVVVSGERRQNLGAWTLADGDDAPRTLQASCPGSLDTVLPSVTLIRAQLRPPE
jgi:hypothetical protein